MDNGKTNGSESRDADFSQLDEEIDPAGKGKAEDGASAEAPGLSKELEKAKAEAAENHDKYLRALAEFENYKKRALKERSDLLKYQGDRIFTELLEVIDNFERALQHSDADAAKFKEGVQLIHRGFLNVLEKWQVRAQSAVGAVFDPSKHAAISKIPAAPGTVPGTIVDELKKAYFYKDKLLRPAEVVVALAEEGNDELKEPPAENVAGESDVDKEEKE